MFSASNWRDLKMCYKIAEYKMIIPINAAWYILMEPIDSFANL